MNDSKALAEFIKAFGYEDNDIVYFRKFDDKKREDFHPANYECTFSNIENILPTLEKSNSNGYGIFFVVNGGGQNDKLVKNVKAHFVEVDDKPMDEQIAALLKFPLEPSVIVKTRRSAHGYWLTKDGNIKKFRNIQQRLIDYFQGDPMNINESRVMRLPFFFHNKEEPIKVELFKFNPDLIYTQEELEAYLPELTTHNSARKAGKIKSDCAPDKRIPAGERFNYMLKQAGLMMNKCYDFMDNETMLQALIDKAYKELEQDASLDYGYLERNLKHALEEWRSADADEREKLNNIDWSKCKSAWSKAHPNEELPDPIPWDEVLKAGEQLPGGVPKKTEAEPKANKPKIETMRPMDFFKEYGFYRFSSLTEDEKKPPEFIVEGLIPVGLSFLSGAPKTRKSFFAFQEAVAVAMGKDFLKFKTTRCKVVYFDLEGSKSRISNRIEKMNLYCPDDLIITHTKKLKVADGTLLKAIKYIVDQKKGYRLFIVDTYSRARGSVKNIGANAYDQDVAFLEPVQSMALELNIAIMFIHHDKKGANQVSDSFERLSGTMGISGSADAVINLVTTAKRFAGEAKMEYTPRDAMGGELELTFDTKTCTWFCNEVQTEDAGSNPVIRWIVSNLPEKGTTEFYTYDFLADELLKWKPDNPTDVIRKIITKYEDTLYHNYHVAVQLGARSNSKRGIRIVRL